MPLSGLSRRTCIFAAAIFICTFTSCLGPHKIDKWVAKHYQDEPIEPPRHKSEQLSFVSKLPELGAATSQTEKNRTHMLPLLFYWKYDYSWGCTLNPELPVNNFESTVLANMGHGLKEKLNGNHLELTIQQMPHAFTIDDKGWYVWIVIYGFGWETITVQPQPTDLVVAYRELTPSNEEVKSGTITIVDPNRKKPLKWFHSLKKTTWQYLEQYDANTTVMSKELVSKLTAEL
jgi:hypothetical protein